MEWLKKLASQGLIRQEVYENILKDVEQVKQASLPENATALGRDIANIAKNAIVFMGVSAAGAAGANLAKKLMHKTTEDGIVKQIKSNAQAILSSPEFAKDQQKAIERYKELCGISVNVAMNLPLSKAIIQKNLYSGFSNDDIIRFSTIQSLSHAQSSHGSESLTSSIRPHVMGKIAADVYLLKKEAGDKGAIKGSLGLMSAMVGTSLLMGGIGAGFGYISDKIKGKNLQVNLQKSFADAVSRSDLLKEKSDEARDAFKTLTHFAPHVALEPKAARSFMEKLVAYGDVGGHVDVSDIKSLSDINKNYNMKPLSGASKGFKNMFDITGGSKATTGMNTMFSKELMEE